MNKVQGPKVSDSEAVLSLVGGQGGLTRNLGVQLTLLQPGRQITASPPGFENPAASLRSMYLGLFGKMYNEAMQFLFHVFLNKTNNNADKVMARDENKMAPRT